MAITLQITGNASIKNSKKLSAEEKKVLLGRTVTFTVGGETVVGTLVESQSGGLTARFAVKVEAPIPGPPKPKAPAGESGLESLRALIAAEVSESETEHEELGL